MQLNEVMNAIEKALDDEREEVSASVWTSIEKRVQESLRAQADARPVAEWQSRYMGDPRQPGFWNRVANVEWAESQYKAIGSRPNKDGWEVRPLYTHPEASAPGLSDDWALLQEAFRFGQFADDFDVPLAKPLRAAIRTILTRASAATSTPNSVRKALQYALSELAKPPFGGMVDCTPIMQALIDTGGIDMNASAATVAEPKCAHRIVDARNPVVKSGYLCIDCGAVFSAADHEAAQQQAEPCPESAMCPACYYGEPMESCIGKQAEPGADVREAEAYVVMGYGETDLPQVSVVYGAGAAKAAVIGMIYHPSTDCPQDEREEYLHGFDDPDNWSQGEWEGLKFEIGGVRVWRADVSIAAQSGQRAGVAEGWKLVPVEPTPEMIAAFKRAFDQGSIWTGRVTHAYKAALAAAPTQQQEGGS